MRSSGSARGSAPTAESSSTSMTSWRASSRRAPTCWATRPSATWRRGSWTGRRKKNNGEWQSWVRSACLGGARAARRHSKTRAVQE
eukprot:3671248-Pyramimonas_sp.AAC.1